METKRRLVVRVITWRITGILMMMLLSWITMQDPLPGLIIGAPYHLIRGVTMLGHEYAWSKFIKWGVK